MEILRLPPKITNLQVVHLPESVFPSDVSVPGGNGSLEKYISLKLGNRRAILRCSLSRLPEDGPKVIWCDTRVQQLLRDQGRSCKNLAESKGLEKFINCGKENLEEEEEKRFHPNIPTARITSCEKVDEKDDEVGGTVVGPPVEPRKQQQQMDPFNKAENHENISRETGDSLLKGSRFSETAITACSTTPHDGDGADDEFYDEDGASQEIHQTCRIFHREVAPTPASAPTSRIQSENDYYYREIDLAHHIAEMEEEDDKGNGSCVGFLPFAKGKHHHYHQHHSAISHVEEEQQLPSTVRFNDALACTSKDIQILKSGAIKMMRLTVICHSDLHYQNHDEHEHHHLRSDDSVESCRGRNGAQTAVKGTTLPFSKPSTTTRTTTVYSSSSPTTSSESASSSSHEATFEGHDDGISKKDLFSSTTVHHEREEAKLDEKCRDSPSKPSTSSHQHSNHKKVEDPFTQSVTEIGEKSKLFVKSSPTSSSSSSSTTPTPVRKMKSRRNWKRLENKIRNIFQTYDIHVGEHTLVDLKTCHLASIHSNLSPKVGFVFVEECEIRNNANPTTTSPPVDIGRVTGRTEIIIANVHHISHYHRLLEQEEARRSTSHLFGLQEPAKILQCVMIGMQRMIQKSSTSPYPPVTYSTTRGLTEFSHGLLISGPSGCGKTVVVRETAKKVGAHLLSFNPVVSVHEDVVRFSQLLTEIFTSAVVTASRYPTVLFIPRIHLLFHSNKGNFGGGDHHHHTGGGSSGGQSRRDRVLHHLCTLFDSLPKGLALTVVGSTDKSFLVPLELRRAGRLEKEIVIYPPKESDRVKMLEELYRSSCPPSSKPIDFLQVARQTPGYVAQDLVKLIRLAIFKCQEEDSSQVSEHHLKYAIGRVLPSVLEGALGVVDIQRAVSSLDDIAGLHSVKLDLIKAIVWPLNHPQAFLRMGISPPKGILLYGPPGNCKTTLVRALAASHHTNFLSVSAAELFSSGVGDSEKIVAHLFHRARTASPCILFIDELESIVGSRHNSEKKQTSTNESILSMLLTEMDGVGVSGFSKREHNSNSKESTESLGPLVLVVAATNRPDLIDPALLRPGRFDKLIGVPPLDYNGRLELLRIRARATPFHPDVNFEEIAKETEYYSGADLVNLCKEAAINALTEDMSSTFVKHQHLKEALHMVAPSLNSEMVRAFYEYGKRST